MRPITVGMRRSHSETDDVFVLKAGIGTGEGVGDWNIFEQLGFSLKTIWYLGAMIYAVTGTIFLTLGLVSPSSGVPDIVLLICVAAIVSSPMLVLAGRRELGTAYAIAMAVVGELIIIGAGLLMQPVGIEATIMILPAVLPAAYLLPRGTAMLYIAALGVYGLWWELSANGNAAQTRTIVVIGSFGILLVATVIVQDRLRRVAMVSRDLAHTDALTGLPNLRNLRHRLSDALARAGRGGTEIALYSIDLDDFKHVNDVFSHTAGDDVLREVAAEMNAVLQPGDLLARRGGDEFCVVALVTPGRDLDEFGEHLLTAIRVARLRVCPTINPNGSIAYVTGEAEDDVDSFLERGDEALHKSKLLAHPERSATGGENATRQIASDPVAGGDRAAARRGEFESERELTVWIKRSLGVAVAWQSTAAVLAVPGLVIVLIAVLGTSPDLGTVSALACATGLLALAALCMAGATREFHRGWIHAVMLAAVAVISVLALDANHSRPVLLDLLLPLTVIAACFIRFRFALVQMAMLLGVFSLLLLTSPFAVLAFARVVSTILVILMVFVLLARAQHLTRAFALQSVDSSEVDTLTGIANVRGLRRRLEEEIFEAGLVGGSVALIAVDLDGFKAVNDTYSHSTGDEVLAGCAKTIAAEVRSGDLVARRGGDEFAVVCAPAGDRDIEALVARLSEKILRYRLTACPDLLATASIASVTWKSGEDVDEFVARADLELHQQRLASQVREAAFGRVRSLG